MRMQVILDSSFARPGSAPIWGGKKGEFRDWTYPTGSSQAPTTSSSETARHKKASQPISGKGHSTSQYFNNFGVSPDALSA